MTKQCSNTICRQVKPVAEFYSNIKAKDDLDSWCKSCKKAYVKSYSAENRKRTNSYKRKWADKNPEKSKAAVRAYYQKNREKRLQYFADYRAKNKELVSERNKAWGRKNRKLQLAYTREYQARKIQATPKWLTEEQRKEMQRIYINCPEGYHVDHEIPLKGKNVSGLHVPWNLSYLTASENSRKSNKVA